MALDEDIGLSGLPIPDFIKIDIEDMEFPALKGMQRTLLARRPELFIEMRDATAKEKMENVHAMVDLLETCGYRVDDVENQEYLTRVNLGDRRPSHLHCVRK